MAMDLTGINNKNEYYTNHYFTSIFADNAQDTISAWTKEAKEKGDSTPWNKFKDTAKQFYKIWDRYNHTKNENQSKPMIAEMASLYLNALGYGSANGDVVEVSDGLNVPIFHEVTKKNNAPLLWALLSISEEKDDDVLLGHAYSVESIDDDSDINGLHVEENNDSLMSKLFFAGKEAPRWILLIGIKQIALIDRNKWNEKRYLTFDLDDIFSRHEISTFQALTVLLHKDSLCPEEGNSILDSLDENSHKHSASVSDSLKYALRECIELLGNEVIYDMVHRQKIDIDENPIDASELTIECLRYMYRFLFLLFIEARSNLGFAPMESDVYKRGYSLEGLRDICETVSGEDSVEVQEGYYIDETISELFRLIYEGYPGDEVSYQEAIKMGPLHDVFIMEPLKAHIFDPQYTKMINEARLRNVTMLKIVDLMSISRPSSSKERRGRISYSALGINQMGAVYEALLSYRGFLAEETLYEVKRAKDKFNELDVGYFVTADELENYDEETERVRYEKGDKKGLPRQYEKGTFIYRLAGREREKSASYYTPEVLTKCLVKYALKELLEGKTADEILHLTICEPAMGSAAFLNEAINQLAEAYINKKQEELGEIIEFDKRAEKLQEVKMYIADRNVYGVDLNPTAVELAEVSLWLNTIYKNAYVPWFGTQLVCGNSLIGARRQIYSTSKLVAGKWYEEAPVRIMPGEVRIKKGQRKSAQGIYHFLMGDPGMANYTDKVIKKLEPENIKLINNWRKEFTKPYTDDEVEMLLNLSEIIDDLWDRTVRLRKQVQEATADTLVVYGQTDDIESKHITIREKDKIYHSIYKSEGGENASPYARLKAAMDYWCALWFWPIDKAELLPDRQLFIMEMNMLLEGGIASTIPKSTGQLRFDFNNNTGESSIITEGTKAANKLLAQYSDLGILNLDQLRAINERLKIANDIAEQQKFMHWELEFADIFEEKGGFDLIVGNPPWIKTEWNEQNILSDFYPAFVVKNFSAAKVAEKRDIILNDTKVLFNYLTNYTEYAGMQSYINAIQNYDILKGTQTNLYKCFLPQAWRIGKDYGISAFVHPEGVYDDPKGKKLRKNIFKRLKYHFHFINEKMLFKDIGHPNVFGVSIYSNKVKANIEFDSISNLFLPETIDECYLSDGKGIAGGIKNSNGEWNVIGHKDRIVRFNEDKLKVLSSLEGCSYDSVKLLVLQTNSMLNIINKFACANKHLSDVKVIASECWHETNAQEEETIKRETKFPEESVELVYSGPHIGVANPLFKTPKNVCEEKADYDIIDLTYVSDNYIPRTNYVPGISISKYLMRAPNGIGNINYMDSYKLITRKMLNLKQERTLNAAISIKGACHINGVVDFLFENTEDLILTAGVWASLPMDFYVKVLGKTNMSLEGMKSTPLSAGKYSKSIIYRSLLLNCLTIKYSDLYEENWCDLFQCDEWGKFDVRLTKPLGRNGIWANDTPLRSSYERREALIEIDVLVAMMIGMELNELISIYKIQFPVLQMYEKDTWYDQNGRIVFTNNRSLTGVGLSRKEFEEIKDAKSGIFPQPITDDTIPGGPIKRTIEYVAPFDRCDREKDYEEVWHNFEARFGKK